MNRWKDIKRCKGCQHPMGSHKRAQGISDALGIEVLLCSDCRLEGMACTPRGKIQVTAGGRKRAKETFSRKL